jgi:Actin like proteins N terminal domain
MLPFEKHNNNEGKGEKALMTTVYYGGFDPGSGEATLHVWPADSVEMAKDTMTIDAIIADGRPRDLLKRGDTDATLAQVLRQGEYVLSINGNDYFLGEAIREGRNETDALRDPNRYWSNHARFLLLTLAGILIAERNVELRLVTALPVSLYDKENRVKMKQALEGYYRYSFATAGHVSDREVTVKIGYVAMEGQGILVSAGEAEGDQAVFDIGERTFDLIVADGQRLLTTKCVGEEIGVGLIVDDLKNFTRTKKRHLTTAKAHDVLYAYAHNEPLPVISGVDRDDLYVEIGSAIQRAGRTLTSFISAHLTTDGEDVAASFDRVYLAGGGAYYFRDIIADLIGEEKITMVEDAEVANAYGYTELAKQLERRKADIWETKTYA